MIELDALIVLETRGPCSEAKISLEIGGIRRGLFGGFERDLFAPIELDEVLFESHSAQRRAGLFRNEIADLAGELWVGDALLNSAVHYHDFLGGEQPFAGFFLDEPLTHRRD